LRWLVVALLLSGLAAGSAFAGPPAARAAGISTATAAATFGINGEIYGIAAVSPTNVWAVGVTDYRYLLIAHWNGKRWSQDKAIKNEGYLYAISMVSATDGWAIGAIGTTSVEMIVLHWNGKTWSRDSSAPQAGVNGNSLVTVGGDVWISGDIGDKETPVTLHRTGGRWYVVPVPRINVITALAAASRTSIWGTGDILTSGGTYTQTMLHWNGSVWKTVAFPRWASRLQMEVQDMAPGTGGAVWAAGGSETLSSVPLLVMRWNGKAWLRSPVNVPGIVGSINGIASVPGGAAWGVGATDSGVVIAHWNGKAWTAARYIAIKKGGDLAAVAATSPDDAWAAGYECTETGIACDRGFTQGVVLHWNGKTWS
jgi:hypothetical protein